MTLKSSSKNLIGVVGAGSFGTAIANIIADRNPVLLFVRDKDKAARIAQTRRNSNQDIHPNITITNNIQQVAEQCEVIFPIIPSANFRSMMVQLAPYLKPYHILIHGTKGLDLNLAPNEVISKQNPLTRKHIKTMSEVIREESCVLRVGCLAGPNLAKEIEEHQPAATVVASHFEEVIDIGQKLLKSERFLVYGSNDLIGIELCGILKNIIAIAAGAISGMKLGENSKALLISRGLVEMIHIGKALGGNTQAFLGLAGVGDLVATCTSKLSRNYTVGFRLAQGESLEEIVNTMEEVAEGVNTVKIINVLADSYDFRCPITETLLKIFEGKMSVKESHAFFMKFPFRTEIDFI